MKKYTLSIENHWQMFVDHEDQLYFPAGKPFIPILNPGYFDEWFEKYWKHSMIIEWYE
jgi:hypothetical protein